MAVAVSPPNQPIESSALDRLDCELDDLRGVQVANAKELAALMRRIEKIQRRAHALAIDVLTVSEVSGLHYQDGHSSGKVMSRHVNKLSWGEAAGRDKCRRMFLNLEVLGAAYRDGEVGTDQVMLLGRLHANPRVRDAMRRRQRRFIKDAKRLSFKRFQQRVLEWERITDEDGPEPPGDRAAENRTANLNQNPFDLSWDLAANFTSVQGAFVSQILEAYTQALFDQDWIEAKARVGDGVCMADLTRTHAHRKADALVQICADAAANTGGMAPVAFAHSILWAASTYEEMARRFAGAKPRPFDPAEFRCETIDGDPLDPTEAFANSLVATIRRVVIDAQGVVIDQGAARRFTGLARHALRISGRECVWPGCWVPASRCESDHLHEHAKGGRTNPGNGAPLCGKHNRCKQGGYNVRRDDTGQIRIYRPDGTEIE